MTALSSAGRRLHRLEPAELLFWFGWATVGAAGIEPLARAAGLDHRARISAGGRWFARLERPR